MIGKLTGTIDSVAGSQIILDVNGVGYVVTCSARTLRELARPGPGLELPELGREAGASRNAVSLRIETHVREDAILLFGFRDVAEQEWFRLLTTVQGVGAKVALSIFSTFSPSELAAAIAVQDKAALTRAEGVGPKLALRIVTELKDKSPPVLMEKLLGSDKRASSEKNPTAEMDAVSVLVNLGYRRLEAFQAVAAARQTNATAPLQDLIRLGLAELSRAQGAG